MRASDLYRENPPLRRRRRDGPQQPTGQTAVDSGAELIERKTATLPQPPQTADPPRRGRADRRKEQRPPLPSDRTTAPGGSTCGTAEGPLRGRRLEPLETRGLRYGVHGLENQFARLHVALGVERQSVPQDKQSCAVANRIEPGIASGPRCLKWLGKVQPDLREGRLDDVPPTSSRLALLWFERGRR